MQKNNVQSMLRFFNLYALNGKVGMNGRNMTFSKGQQVEIEDENTFSLHT
jgi:hypothetical protein